MKSKKAKLIFLIIAFIVILTSISCKKDKIIPTASFNIMLQAQGRYIYNLGIPVAAHYDLNVKLKETNGVGAQILSVRIIFYDIYGASFEFDKSAAEIFSTGYISPNQEINANIWAEILGTKLAEAKTVQMTIEFLDDNAHHITKTAQAKVQW